MVSYGHTTYAQFTILPSSFLFSNMYRNFKLRFSYGHTQLVSSRSKSWFRLRYYIKAKLDSCEIEGRLKKRLPQKDLRDFTLGTSALERIKNDTKR